jgi:hypothetical protein
MLVVPQPKLRVSPIVERQLKAVHLGSGHIDQGSIEEQ